MPYLTLCLNEVSSCFQSEVLRAEFVVGGGTSLQDYEVSMLGVSQHYACKPGSYSTGASQVEEQECLQEPL